MGLILFPVGHPFYAYCAVLLVLLGCFPDLCKKPWTSREGTRVFGVSRTGWKVMIALAMTDR